jgi:hypothetical protein
MAARLNARWHMAHPMPKPATLDERVRWHLAHAKSCGCREMPGTIVAELIRRGVSMPAQRAKAKGRGRVK